jgi:ABC-2 type transport system permease protein
MPRRGGTASPYFYGRTPVAYCMPTIAALSVIGTCYGQLAVVLAMRRQDGILNWNPRPE